MRERGEGDSDENGESGGDGSSERVGRRNGSVFKIPPLFPPFCSPFSVLSSFSPLSTLSFLFSPLTLNHQISRNRILGVGSQFI
jgi:hypothetical protein